MTITLVAVQSAADFEGAALRARAEKAPHLETIHLFRAMSGTQEMALVVLDVHPGAPCFILYELFLSAARRNHGVGSRVLAAVEAFVLASGRGFLDVWPRSLDLRNRSDLQLTQWYGRHGYVSAQVGSERLRKTLVAS